jgi:glycosyl transferase, family 25
MYDGAFILNNTIDINTYEKSPHFIGKGLGIYTINLKQHTQKYEDTYNQLSHLGWPIHRIEAIDGKKLSDEDLKQYTDLLSYQAFERLNPNKGTIGCSLSHFEAWQEFLKSDYEFALITEDDIEFDPVALKISIENLTHHKELWDINLFEIFHYGLPVHGLPLTINKFDNDGRAINVYLLDIIHAGAYLINRNAASKLLSKALPIKMPVDHYFTRGWELGNLVITGVEPRIVSQKKASVANSYRKSTGFIEDRLEKDIPTLTKIHQKVGVIKSNIVRFAYNLWQYFRLKNGSI